MKILLILMIALASFVTPACADEAAPKPAYLIAMGRGYDREALGAYTKALPPVYAKYGGTYVAIASDITVLEGEYPYQSIVVSRWPDLATVKAFWASPEYAAVKKLREGLGAFDVIAFEGFPGSPQAPTPAP